MPKVSVVMSVYNGELYVKEAIKSILQQTFDDFEFVIIEDGSTDSTLSILKAYAQQDPRIVLVCNEKNLGLQRSLNKGLSVSCGEYIARLDADDVSLGDRLQLQVAFLDAHPEIGLLGSAVEIIDEQKNSVVKNYVPLDHESIQATLLINNYFHHSSMMFRRNLVEQLGGYDETKRYVEDYDLWWRFSRVTQLANLPDVLIQRRFRGTSITWAHRLDMLRASWEISIQAIQEYLQDVSLDAVSYKRFWWTYYSQREPLQVEAQFCKEDIKRLESFWKLLENHPAGALVWGPRLRTMAHNLLRQQKTAEGLELLWIVSYRLATPILWRSALKSLLKPYIPAETLQTWKNWQLKQTGKGA